METTEETSETSVDELGVGHEFGSYLVGGIAAYGANKLAQRLYTTALYAIRARRSA